MARLPKDGLPIRCNDPTLMGDQSGIRYQHSHTLMLEFQEAINDNGCNFQFKVTPVVIKRKRY